MNNKYLSYSQDLILVECTQGFNIIIVRIVAIIFNYLGTLYCIFQHAVVQS